jgi:predicted nucleotidyltransferase
MRSGEFDEALFFRAIHESGARALLIGRRALVLLGLPVLTADYDFWIAIDDIDAFNTAVARCELYPTRTPDEARRRGRYAVENDEHVDVLVARSVTTMDGVAVAFEDVWTRRRTVTLGPDVTVHMPVVDDLILTKRFADRPKDLEDIRLLRAITTESGS